MAEQARASGATPERIQQITKEAQDFAAIYANPAIRIAITFTAIFPIGVVISLISAAPGPQQPLPPGAGDDVGRASRASDPSDQTHPLARRR